MESTPKYGRYTPVYQLGDGGAARVWAGHVSGVHAPFALKYLRGELLGNHLYEQRFAREAQIGLAVSGEHPNIVTVRAYDPDAGGTPLLVLDLVGPPVSAVKDRLVGDANTIRWIAAEALRALRHIESCGVVHRDISPGNLLIAPNGRVRLNDFGNATRYDGTASAGIVGGTIPYVSPELLRGDRGTPASDAFSLGAVVFELVTGEPPFGTNLEAVVLAQARGVPELPRSVPRDLRCLILGLLVLDEGRRLRAVEAASLLARVDERAAAVRLGPLARQWLSERCPTLVGELSSQRVERGPGLAVWEAKPRQRSWHVMTPAVATVAAAACAGAWILLDAQAGGDGNRTAVVRASNDARQPTVVARTGVQAARQADTGITLAGASPADRATGEAPSLVAYDPRNKLPDDVNASPASVLSPASLAAIEREEREASADLRAAEARLRSAREHRPPRAEPKGRVARQAREPRIVQDGEAAAVSRVSQSARELALEIYRGDVQWAAHGDGGGIQYGRARWQGTALVMDLRVVPPFEPTVALLAKIEGKFSGRDSDGWVQVRFANARSVVDSATARVGVVFGGLNGEPLVVTFEVP